MAKKYQPQTLNLIDVVDTALKAMAEGRLQAQLMTDEKRKQMRKRGVHVDCFYSVPRKPGCGCAIGVSMTPETLKAVKKAEKEAGHTLNFSTLVSQGIVKVPANDYGPLNILQSNHDGWVRGELTEKDFVEACADLKARAIAAQKAAKKASAT